MGHRHLFHSMLPNLEPQKARMLLWLTSKFRSHRYEPLFGKGINPWITSVPSFTRNDPVPIPPASFATAFSITHAGAQRKIPPCSTHTRLLPRVPASPRVTAWFCTRSVSSGRPLRPEKTRDWSRLSHFSPVLREAVCIC